MRKIVVVAFLVTVFSTMLLGQAGFRLRTRNAADLNAEQRRLVGTWCRQDFEGLRLSDAGWDRFKQITAFKKNPEFNSIVIVSRFQVESRDTMSWDTDVTYTIVGRYERGAGYMADPGIQTVTFQTKDIEGDIMIVNVDPISPHVSKKTAVEWMKKELETTASDIEKIHLRDALKVLEPTGVAGTEPSR